MKNDYFGINMKKYSREYEATVRAAVSEGKATDEMIEEHREKIAWVQHERLVHLIVTMMCVICELFIICLVLLHPELGILPVIIMLVFAILLAFYFYHYFFLENTVQRWYMLVDEMRGAADTEDQLEKQHNKA